MSARANTRNAAKQPANEARAVRIDTSNETRVVVVQQSRCPQQIQDVLHAEHHGDGTKCHAQEYSETQGQPLKAS
eukprot:6209623-Pleurochrysis_carterae.AAC.2